MTKMYVESTDLTAVANAIRTKGGTSSPLVFPAGFSQAIADIPSGGGGAEITSLAHLFYNGARIDAMDDILTQVKDPTGTADYCFYQLQTLGSYNIDLSAIDGSGLTSMQSTFEQDAYGSAQIQSVKLPQKLFSVGSLSQCFNNCKYLTSVTFPLGTGKDKSSQNYKYLCNNCQRLQVADVSGCLSPSSSGQNNNMFSSCSALKKVAFFADRSNGTYIISGWELTGCNALEELVIPGSVVASLGTSWQNCTPLSGKTAKIYVPDSLVSAYKSATNWSTYADIIHGFSDHSDPWWASYQAA